MGAYMIFDERTNRLRQELATMGLSFESNERTDRLIQELAAEKEAQLEGAKAVIKPLIFVAAIAIFIVCFWWYDAGLLLSIGAAVLTLPVLSMGISLPIGYILGKRAVRRFKVRLAQPDADDRRGSILTKLENPVKGLTERMQIVLVVNLMTIAILVLLWISSNLSWTSAAGLFTLWLLCPFGITWSWPEGKPLSIWRTIISWLAIVVVSVVAAVSVHFLTTP